VSAVLASVGRQTEAARIAFAISNALYGAITDVMSAAVCPNGPQAIAKLSRLARRWRPHMRPDRAGERPAL
jgi:hypothetical protein